MIRLGPVVIGPTTDMVAASARHRLGSVPASAVRSAEQRSGCRPAILEQPTPGHAQLVGMATAQVVGHRMSFL